MYYIKKRHVYNTGGCWYDHHKMYLEPLLMEKYKTLGLFNQQGMEGSQKMQKKILLSFNGGGAQGNYDNATRAAGEAAIEALLAKRRAGSPLITKWCMRKHALAFRMHPPNAVRIDRTEELLAAGRTMDWRTEWAPEMQRWMLAVRLMCRWVGRIHELLGIPPCARQLVVEALSVARCRALEGVRDVWHVCGALACGGRKADSCALRRR